ncbi:phospholipase A1-like [Andrena cerasifolii]|uniref:phospholipase A1-like n=1 Tax=Andrena cerasifolii TaxID=2819439 RepID=UPI004038351D
MSAPNATMVYQTSLTLFATLMQANYSIFPDGDGVPHLIKIDYEPLTSEELEALEEDVKSTTFTLYTRRRPQGQIITINDPESVSRSDWNPDRSTIFSTHGWKSGGNTEACTTIRDAYLKIFDCNVIVFDWSKIAQNLYYPTVAKSVPRVAEHVASFVNFMRLKANLDTKQTKIVGHSLGAHVSSLAARAVKQSSLMAEVIALDPAKPMFEDNGPDGRVDKSHADYVQVVHTNAGLLGMSKAVGTSDFYGNGGKTQPGCGFDLFGICAHSRSYIYYGESVGNPKGFPGKSTSGAPQDAHMGGPVLDAAARGHSFDFPTRDKTPFATVPLAA